MFQDCMCFFLNIVLERIYLHTSQIRWQLKKLAVLTKFGIIDHGWRPWPWKHKQVSCKNWNRHNLVSVTELHVFTNLLPNVKMKKRMYCRLYNVFPSLHRTNSYAVWHWNGRVFEQICHKNLGDVENPVDDLGQIHHLWNYYWRQLSILDIS